ncbi:hypothetical protein [Pseudobdellovibrio sp. HCB154]|uniref:hypothetical protein n=1 Tax=Pseudobdellovibrio sp. HCB154 TaxID=3386277 RepID=UPI0039170904
MIHLLKFRLVVLLSLIFVPLFANADAINPLLNLFTEETASSALVLTLFIILIESIILNRFIKTVRFQIHIWRTTLFNTLSSAAGSAVAFLFYKENIHWGMSELYLPMFLITLVTETPMIRYLYRHENFSWLRSIKFSLAINITSYFLLFFGQFGIALSSIFFGQIVDENTIKKWNEISILDGESGYIYTVKNLNSGWPEKNIFNRYDVELRKWSTLDLGFKEGFNSWDWDVRKNIIACIETVANNDAQIISIFNTDKLSKISEIKSKGGEMRISPDLSKLAVLEFDKRIGAPKDDDSHFMLGTSNKLRIYDINTGTLLFESPRLALDEGMTWLNNSKEVIFTSFREEALFNNNEDIYHSMGYGRAYSKPNQFPVDLFIYNLETNSVKLFTEGIRPNSIASTDQITFIKELGFEKYELWKSDINLTNREIVFANFPYSARYKTSPSGLKYLFQIPHKDPLRGNSFLTISTADNSDYKFIIEPYYRSEFRWIEK